MADDSDDEGLFDGLFGGGGEEEEERDEEVKMVTDSYSRKRPGADPSEITMYLIASQHSLWGNKLWNASIVLAVIYDELSYVCKGKHFLELGAGAGLPGLICALNGAERVVITDYGTECDYSLVEVIQQNGACCISLRILMSIAFHSGHSCVTLSDRNESGGASFHLGSRCATFTSTAVG